MSLSLVPRGRFHLRSVLTSPDPREELTQALKATLEGKNGTEERPGSKIEGVGDAEKGHRVQDHFSWLLFRLNLALLCLVLGKLVSSRRAKQNWVHLALIILFELHLPTWDSAYMWPTAAWPSSPDRRGLFCYNFDSL